MSPFDLVVLTVTVLATLAVLFPAAPLRGPARYLPYAALALAGFHLASAYRAAFIPVYGIAALVALSARPSAYRRVGLRRGIGASALFALGAGGVLAAMFPMFRLPTPTGPYAIGSRSFDVTDSTRLEDLSPDSTDRRRLLARIWYPADAPNGEPLPMLSPMQATSVARGFNLPAMTLAHLARIPTHSYLNAPLSNKQQQWPVLLFSHGFGIGYESQNTVQMEELASHGYVIVSIDHTYEAGVVVFPDGQVAYGGAPVAPDSASIARLTELVKGLATLTDTTQLKALANDMRATMKLDPSMTRWLADTRFILDQLPTALAEWAPRLQLDRVGLFGMSFGGATAESFCTIDPRCAAGVNLDGLSFGPSTEQAMPRPFLFATSGTNTHMYDVPYLRALAPVTRMGVANSLHLDYTDVGFFSPLFVRLGALGGIPAREMHRIMNTALLTWFNHHLHGAALDWTPLRAFPQVTLDQRSP